MSGGRKRQRRVYQDKLRQAYFTMQFFLNLGSPKSSYGERGHTTRPITSANSVKKKRAGGRSGPAQVMGESGISQA